MDNPRCGRPELFEAFVKSTQYLVRLKRQQDIWEHVGKFIITHLPASWTAFIERDEKKKDSILHCTLAGSAAQRLLTGEVTTLVADVLENGFLTTCVTFAPDPSMTAVLPVVEEHQSQKVLLIGHRGTASLSKELLNIYLAVAGLAGATSERLRNEGELVRHRAHLEELVKERTAELKNTVIQLKAANEELEAFSYSVSHDLRTPLRSITGFSQVLIEDYAESLDETARDSLDRIVAAAGRMDRLIGDMLNLSRVTRSELKREQVDLTAMAKTIADDLMAEEPGRRANIVIADDLVVEGDGRLLYQVLENLLGNAWKFTTKNSEPRIELGRLTEGDGTAYFVKDNGIGFDMEYAGKLFNPFHRLHKMSEYAGTGIGLATVKRIIERHGGRVWIEGETGKGATAYFTLA